MRRLISVLLLAVLSIPFARAAEPYEVGRHYLELPFPQPVETGAKIEVREFFWYGCSHCYAFEPALNRWLGKLPANAQFVRTPGTAPKWLTQAQAFYAFESLGVTEKVHGPLFRAIHDNKQRLDDEASLAQFVGGLGVDANAFRQAFNSFGVRMRLEKARKMNEDFDVHSVPVIVVDGQYLTSPAMAGNGEAATKVVEFLIRKAAKGRKGAGKR